MLRYVYFDSALHQLNIPSLSIHGRCLLHSEDDSESASSAIPEDPWSKEKALVQTQWEKYGKTTEPEFFFSFFYDMVGTHADIKADQFSQYHRSRRRHSYTKKTKEGALL